MAKYSKSETLKIIMFWMFVIGIISFIIDSILAIAQQPQAAVIAIFVIALLFTLAGITIWVMNKIQKTNRKVAGR